MKLYHSLLPPYAHDHNSQIINKPLFAENYIKQTINQ